MEEHPSQIAVRVGDAIAAEVSERYGPSPSPPLPVGAIPPPSGIELLAKAAAEKAQLDAQADVLLAQRVTRSESIAAFAAALARAQKNITSAARDSKNPFFKSKYASLSAILDACRDALADQEIAYSQPITCRGKLAIISTLLMHSSGEWIEERLALTAKEDSPQGIASAVTYGRRIALAAMVGVAPEDDDGEAATHKLPEGVKWDKGTSDLQIHPDTMNVTSSPADSPSAPKQAPGHVLPPTGPLQGSGGAGSPVPPSAPKSTVSLTSGQPLPSQPRAPQMVATAVVPPPPGMKPPAKAPGR